MGAATATDMATSGRRLDTSVGKVAEGMVVGIRLVTPSTTEVMMLTTSPTMGGVVGVGSSPPRSRDGSVGEACRDKAIILGTKNRRVESVCECCKRAEMYQALCLQSLFEGCGRCRRDRQRSHQCCAELARRVSSSSVKRLSS